MNLRKDRETFILERGGKWMGEVSVRMSSLKLAWYWQVKVAGWEVHDGLCGTYLEAWQRVNEAIRQLEAALAGQDR